MTQLSNPSLLQQYTARAKAMPAKSKSTDTDTELLWKSPWIKGAVIACGCLIGIYLLGKSLRIVADAVTDAKYFAAAIKK